MKTSYEIATEIPCQTYIILTGIKIIEYCHAYSMSKLSLTNGTWYTYKNLLLWDRTTASHSAVLAQGLYLALKLNNT